jgi:hypothetical protein
MGRLPRAGTSQKTCQIKNMFSAFGKKSRNHYTIQTPDFPGNKKMRPDFEKGPVLYRSHPDAGFPARTDLLARRYNPHQ